MNACPDDATLRRFLHAGPDESLDGSLALHVKDCPACQLRASRWLAGGPRAGGATSVQAGSTQSTPPVSGTSETALRQGAPAIPGFEVVDELGRGGMGVVYRARQVALNRIVALKVVQAGQFASPEQRQRFRTEVEATARVQHSHVVQVYSAGEHEGCPYLVTECVEGGNLARVLHGVPQPPQDAARLVLLLARGIHAAHKQGIIHRDLKPGNVLLGPVGDESALACRYGVPKIADFGLARSLKDMDSHSLSALVGTVAYMAPEQAAARKDLKPTVDVYALGVILYECCTGRRPFVGEDQYHTLCLVQEADPVPPSRLAPRMPRDLETICLKCLHKKPDQRYAGADELADDLQRFLDGEPIKARRQGRAERGMRWLRRHPATTAVGALVLAAAALIVGILEVSAHRRESARADGLVVALGVADAAQLPGLTAQLEPLRHRVRDLLARIVAKPEAELVARRNAAAFLAREDGPWVDYLVTDARQAPAASMPILRDALRPHVPRLQEELWQRFLDASLAESERLRLACLLAADHADDPRWAAQAEVVVPVLLRESIASIGTWMELLRPFRAGLLPSLSTAFGDSSNDEGAYRAALAIGELYADQQEVLLGLLPHASPRQLDVLLPRFNLAAPGVVAALQRQLAEERGWSPALPDPASPDDPEDRVDEVARRQARAALVLLGHGRADLVWPLLRNGPDPRLRTYLIHLMAGAGIDPALLGRRLDVERDPAVRHALLLALGEYRFDTIPSSERQRWRERLLRLYQHDPDPGVHAAAGWLLRRWKQGHELEALDQALRSRDPVPGRGWYVNRQGQTFAVVDASAEFISGSPATEWHRDWTLARREDTAHRIIPRTLAVALTEVTVADFLRMDARFRPDRPSGRSHYSPELSCPIDHVSPELAMRYCRWLSEQEGIPDDQQCYPPLESIQPDTRAYPDYVHRTGYRLPTAAEWEFLCRAGTRTRFFFGADHALAPLYGWCQQNTFDRSQPVGLLRPNAFGLFDILGNMMELCHGTPQRSPDPFMTHVDEGRDPEGKAAPVLELRGGGFSDHPGAFRVAQRWAVHPAAAYGNHGFRVVRTLAPSALQVLPRGNGGRCVELRVKGSGSFTARADDPQVLEISPEAGVLPATLQIRWRQEREAAILVEHAAGQEAVRVRFPLGSNPPQVVHYRTNSLGMRLALLPAGPFVQGTRLETVEQLHGALANTRDYSTLLLRSETPPRRVMISRPFGIGVHEVTVGAFRQFTEATRYVTEEEHSPIGWGDVYVDGRWRPKHEKASWRNPGHPQGDAHPVTFLSLIDIENFCLWLSARERLTYRLPTEAEWEYACRAGSSALRFFGDDPTQLGDYAWYSDNANNPQPVGTKRPNAFGLHDMLGNVFERCADWFDARAYETDHVTDPQGPSSPRDQRGGVRRGDDVTGRPPSCRCGRRYDIPWRDGNNLDGFRVVCSPWKPGLSVEVLDPGTAREYEVTGPSGLFVVESVRGPASVEPRVGRVPGRLQVRCPPGQPGWYAFTVRRGDGGKEQTIAGLHAQPRWTARYYPWSLPENTAERAPTEAEWAQAIARPPLREQTLPSMELLWREETPHADLARTRFALVGTTEFDLPAGVFELTAEAHDGLRVFLDDQRIMDTWWLVQPHVNRTEVRLAAGRHRIRLEGFHHPLAGYLRLALRPLRWE